MPVLDVRSERPSHIPEAPAQGGDMPVDDDMARHRTILGRMTDEQLVQRAQAGDGLATEFILAKYKQLVVQHTRPYYIIGGDREDLVQEGMIGLFKAIRDYSVPRGPFFQSFAGICIRRQIITAIKTASRMKCLPLNRAHSLHAMECEDDPRGPLEILFRATERAPEEVWLDYLETQDIYQLMKRRLSKLEYQSVAMYATGLSYHEIAHRLGRHSQTIDRALFRGKRKVRGILASREK
ncbi:MAG: sigma-70 family RNA polymerase sigma factor [Armatimonadetes bacterium]|nr:sigma-70 family RNA polymerase sigma factor [Armatimonadota bacterium]PIU62361.1 MAG: RNA polymerase sporulation sigma factor SigH [Armatimonadetes bacterium CG07_land_8_20_14_0_80_59_28]PIX45031.1 MAG: RNA polymerase sporulation sigma factor SigH [Armatimonadetes bacterium CG_4_8_14_3_um_filter_58_9]PIY40816.1 MAG: RNA polymerase sporulation sigma factor SigH [Armatimonadetes bacterium CG_4_10_14_3_um_filter_59_10]PJB74316.1 MAG: RNA polymerase sporulation sigma factor SigH [Armatimonadetes